MRPVGPAPSRNSSAICDSNSTAFSDAPGRATDTEEIDMLGNKDASANSAVRNLDVARKFYEGVLGLEKVGEQGTELVTYQSGKSRINVYRSQFAGTNQATAVTWNVGTDIEGFVARLKAKGVKFEHYDMPELKREGDIYIGGRMKVAWFKDSDGNILNIVTG
jgi:catechol 2,3-dioxygenase-like lactoylglutathione lyase family enzyme